jgi:glycosyltransferase involved in cell wall biosynthesis
MHVLTIATYPPIECGIGTYTHWLRCSLIATGRVRVSVIAPAGASGDDVFPIYEPDSPSSLQRIQEVATRCRPDIVHIQHEYGLFGRERGRAVLELFKLFHGMKVPIVTTLHTVNTAGDPLKRQLLSQIVHASTCIIVHEAFQKAYITQTLGEHLREKVNIIEHGIRTVTPVPYAKRQLGLADVKVVLLCGYIRPRKAFHHIVEVFPNVARAVPNAVLVVGTALRRPDEYVDYRDALLTQIAQSPCVDRIQVHTGHLTHDEIDTLVSAADVVVLPYEQGAQSGILANALAFGRAVVTSGLPAFEAIVTRTGAGIVARDRDAFVAAIIEVLANATLRAQFEACATLYAHAHASWDAVCLRHEETYRSACTAAGEAAIAAHGTS